MREPDMLACMAIGGVLAILVMAALAQIFPRKPNTEAASLERIATALENGPHGWNEIWINGEQWFVLNDGKPHHVNTDKFKRSTSTPTPSPTPEPDIPLEEGSGRLRSVTEE